MLSSSVKPYGMVYNSAVPSMGKLVPIETTCLVFLSCIGVWFGFERLVRGMSPHSLATDIGVQIRVLAVARDGSGSTRFLIA
jgi:hypothetical protein